jgi:His/Glu/Gln/Arg/opine family amino acid ABC transporter permease subunit
MSQSQVRPRESFNEALFSFLRDVPWWGVIVAIVGVVVAYSVLTDIQYLDAIYFLFDFPWNKELIAEVPVQDEIWQFTPEANTPLQPGTYRIRAEFYKMTAETEEDTTLYAEPSTDGEPTADVPAGERVQFVRWEIIPRQELTMEQRWVRVVTRDGRVGWALDRQFQRLRDELVAESDAYAFRIPQDAEPSEDGVVVESSDKVTEVQTSTPTLQGPVLDGVWVQLYNHFDWQRTVARAWNSNGLVLTIRATVIGYTLALFIGLFAGLMLVSKNPITLAISKLYVEVVRGIPMLVIILYAGFVLSPYLREATNGRIDLRGFPGAVIGLGFGYGAYLAEVFRAGIQSIDRGQMEAARSLGMSYVQAMRHVVLPQALRVVLPPLGNDFIAMLKDSSLISVVALPELLQQGRLWVSRTFRAFEGYNTVALFYLVMTLLLSLAVRLIERKIALPGRVED